MARKQNAAPVQGSPPAAPAAAPVPAAKASTEVMLNWKQARLLVFHPPQSGSMLSTLSAANSVLTPDQVKAELKQHKALTILPGIHAYPAHLWAEAKSHPLILALLRDEQLVVITNAVIGKTADTSKANEPAAAMPATLDNVGTAQARDLVEGCTDLALLKKWQEAEKVSGEPRQTVLDALKGQVELLIETDKRFKGESE